MGFSFKAIFKAAVVAAVVATGVGAMAAAGYLGAGMAATVAAAGGIMAYATTAAVMAGLTAAVSSLLAETPKNFDLGDALRGQLITTRAPAGDARIVYGETRVGGIVLFVQTTGSKNELMHQAFAVAGHEITSVETIYLNDQATVLKYADGVYFQDPQSNDPILAQQILGIMLQKFGGNPDPAKKYFEVDWRLGTTTQSPFSTLFSGTDAVGYQFKGIAVIGFRIEYDQDVWAQGLPNITAKIKGKKVYDPRTSTTAYSNNAALCIRDYLTDTTYGLGATAAELDDDSFEEAADICDEDIDLAEGGTEKRYTINGAFSSAEQPKDVLSKMLTACSGKLSYAGGKWVLRVGAYRSPSKTLDEDDIIGAIQMQASQSRRDIFNAIKGTYSEPTALYQPETFPPVTNSLYESEDGEQIWKDIQFPFTTSSPTCQRLAKIELEKARQQITVNISCKLTAFELQPGDTVNLNFSRYGWTNKVFEVLTWEYAFSDSDTGPTPVINMALRETASAIYDWDAEETAVDLAPNTNLPDPFLVDKPGIAVADTLQINAETIVTRLEVTVTGENTFQNRYEVQAKVTTDTEYVNLGQASGNLFVLVGALDGVTYDVRARSINTLGVRSEWVEAQHQVVGKTAPPQNVSNFAVNIINTEAHLSWTAVTDLDLSHYRIRHSRATTGAIYSDAIDLVVKVPRPAVSATVPAMTGTYFIKAVDKLGNDSLEPAEIVAIIEDIKGLNVVETITESPTFAGYKNGTAKSNGSLVLNTSVLFDDLSGLFDDASGDFDSAGGNYELEGTYDFDNVVDLGSVYTSRVTARIEQERLESVNLFDDAPGNFDDREGLFDGDPNVFDDVNVEMYVSTTEDDPADSGATWSAYRKFFVGDYKARGLKFRARLTSENGTATPVVNVLSVTIDMPDRIAAGSDISSGTDSGGKVVSFIPAFKVAPAIGIAAQNLNQGDYFVISNKTNSSFTIKFYDSGANVVDRTFDYVAKGYGELAA